MTVAHGADVVLDVEQRVRLHDAWLEDRAAAQHDAHHEARGKFLRATAQGLTEHERDLWASIYDAGWSDGLRFAEDRAREERLTGDRW